MAGNAAVEISRARTSSVTRARPPQRRELQRRSCPCLTGRRTRGIVRPIRLHSHAGARVLAASRPGEAPARTEAAASATARSAGTRHSMREPCTRRCGVRYRARTRDSRRRDRGRRTSRASVRAAPLEHPAPGRPRALHVPLDLACRQSFHRARVVRSPRSTSSRPTQASTTSIPNVLEGGREDVAPVDRCDSVAVISATSIRPRLRRSEQNACEVVLDDVPGLSEFVCEPPGGVADAWTRARAPRACDPPWGSARGRRPARG